MSIYEDLEAHTRPILETLFIALLLILVNFVGFLPIYWVLK